MVRDEKFWSETERNENNGTETGKKGICNKSNYKSRDCETKKWNEIEMKEGQRNIICAILCAEMYAGKY